MGENLICSFFGHREITVTPSLRFRLAEEFQKAIDLGCRIFYCGAFGDFDKLCYEVICEMQQRYPQYQIKKVYCAPLESELRKSKRLPKEQYDDYVYLTPKLFGWYRSIFFRNVAMIDASSYVVFYAENRENSGAYKAYKYAKKSKNKRVVNLWEDELSN